MFCPTFATPLLIPTRCRPIPIRTGPASAIPPVPAAARFGPASLRTAAGSDVLPLGEASSNAHVSPAALRSSPAVAANWSASTSIGRGSASRRHKLPRLYAITLSHSRTSFDRNRWQLSRVIFTACLPSLIHCSAMPRLFVEAHHRPARRLQVGHDKPQAREQFPGMEFHLRHHTSCCLPTRRLIEKALVPHDGLVTGPSYRARQREGKAAPRSQIFSEPIKRKVGSCDSRSASFTSSYPAKRL
jgi:hypothetical protein